MVKFSFFVLSEKTKHVIEEQYPAIMDTEESECILDIGQNLNIIDVRASTEKVHLVCELIKGGTE